MPVIHRQNGLVFFFYSNDHQPIHVHVRKGKGRGKGKAAFKLQPIVELESGRGFTMAELTLAFDIATTNREAFIAAWNQHHGQ